MPRRYLPILVAVAAALSGGVSWVISKPFDETAGWRILRVALSPSERWIAVGSASGWIGIIDQRQPEGPQRFRGGTGALRDLRFSKDEQWLFVHKDDVFRHPVQQLGALEVVPHGQDIGTPQLEGRSSVDHSSNVVTGATLTVFGNAAGSIEVHDTATGAMLRRFTFR